MSKRNPYQAIMIACAQGKGLHLSPSEVYELACDGAIETVASNTLEPEAFEALEQVNHWKFWAKRKADVRETPFGEDL